MRFSATVGLLDDGYTVELRPHRQINVSDTNWPVALPTVRESREQVVNQAIAIYQLASKLLSGAK